MDTAPARSCGPCSLCCKVMSVSAIPKGSGVWCPHVKRATGGCAIYEDRPRACRYWKCAWLEGNAAFTDADRPDLTGVVPSVDGKDEVHLHEDRAGALEEPALVAVQGRLLALGVTIVRHHADKRVSIEGPNMEKIRWRYAHELRQAR